ncbi:ATP-binding protein [Undibacterium flavidum]|uniref:histidine kinase n=1 Tax=Undibacterium flavidum TaxID=2762297 RepID=A0ABR6YGC2_9BURK|nr:ATP-binding protein [Undibacterium flavidum]MBC3875609.1 ATP-binding protein [Undibacterium flavidum]
MNRLFLRFLLPVLLSIALATMLVYAVIIGIFGDPIEKNAERQAAPQIFLIEQYIDKAATDEWLARLNKVREVSQVPFELLPLPQVMEKLDRAQRAKLRQGRIVVDAANRALYRRVDLDGEKYIGSDEDVLQVQNLPIDYWFNIQLEIVRFVIVAFVLLIPIAFWSRAHWRDIQALSHVTAEIGEGNLAARAGVASNAAIYPLAQQINQMGGRIEQLINSQKNLLHSVSHELRTPIARLEFALEILQDTPQGMQASDKSKARIQAMQADLSELNSLVSELLNMAKLDAQGQLTTEVIDALDLMQTCMQHLPPVPEHIQLRQVLEVQTLQLVGDRRLLERAIQNLLKNALKYAEKNIVFTLKQHANSHIVIVEDDGAGIPEADRNKIFEPFYRLDRSRDRSTGGFGLGLAIVKQIVTLHRGSIRISQASIGGARFEIRLPDQST